MLSTLGERLREVRKTLHITQVEIGGLIGVSGSGISQIEAGASRPTEAAVKLICQTYHVNYLWLTEGRGEMLEAETPAEMVERLMAGQHPVAVAIMKAFAELPTEEWEKLRDLIDRVKSEGLSE